MTVLDHTEYGLLIPAPLTEPCRPFTWGRQARRGRPAGFMPLLDVLYRELDSRDLDAATVTPTRPDVPGGVRLWCHDSALLVAEPAYNDRAIAVCRHFGYNVPALAGPIALIGCPRGDDEGGLNRGLLNWLLATLEASVKATADGDPHG